MLLIINILIGVFLAVVSAFIPIGNENSTVRRLPWVTFSIIGLNVVIFFVTLPIVVGQQQEMMTRATRIEQFIQEHQELLADEGVRKNLSTIGIIGKSEADSISEQLKKSPDIAAKYQDWLTSFEAQSLLSELDQKVTSFKTATEDSFWYKYGLSPNGNWKPHQLITAAFLHGGLLHLLFNMIFFFAVAFSLEDLWGRGVFLGFYLLGAVAACLPSLISPIGVPMIGASGAISATMAAFLFRLPKTKLKLLFLIRSLGLLVGKKSLVVMLPGYVYIVAYFSAQVIVWYHDKQAGSGSNVAYSAHFAGFAFGAVFALVMKFTKYEELHINPKIEAKVSFSAAPAVTMALEAMDNGDNLLAERKLRAHLAREPNDTNAMLAAIQLFQNTSNFDRMNSMYARLIRLHLENHDKEAALYAYDGLLSAFPDDNIAPRIPVRDWVTICEHLMESDLKKEAAVEYERLITAWPEDPYTSRAAVQGGEAALSVNDADRALRMFLKAEAMHVGEPYAGRARKGIEQCSKLLETRNRWAKHPPAISDAPIEDLTF